MPQPDLTRLIALPAVWDRLERVEERLMEVTESQEAFLTKISRHLITAGGKRLRPLIAQITAELGPHPDTRAVEAGTAVELIHLGSLYHDDVIDEADSRRGATSVNHNWSNTIAILAGDFVLARASEVAARSLGQEAVVLLAQTYAQLCEGQLLELQLTDDLTHGPEEYRRVIGNKTASLIRTSARLGALSADADRTVVEAVSRWAWEVGMAFQLVDDVLDLVASSDFLGKPTGSDIGEGTFTLPVLLGLRGPDGDKLEALLAGGHPYVPETVERVIALVRAGGHVDDAIAEAANHVRSATELLSVLPAGAARTVLAGLGDYVMGQIDVARSA